MRRESLEARAARIEQLLANPDLNEAYTAMRNRIIREMDDLVFNGANDHEAANLIRKLQATAAFKKELTDVLKAFDRKQMREGNRQPPNERNY